MTSDQITALGWVVSEVIDLSNGRRPFLAPDDAASEYDALNQVIAIIASHDAALAAELRSHLGRA